MCVWTDGLPDAHVGTLCIHRFRRHSPLLAVQGYDVTSWTLPMDDKIIARALRAAKCGGWRSGTVKYQQQLGAQYFAPTAFARIGAIPEIIALIQGLIGGLAYAVPGGDVYFGCMPTRTMASYRAAFGGGDSAARVASETRSRKVTLPCGRPPSRAN
jgi:cysteinyl-tRNA synthetase